MLPGASLRTSAAVLAGLSPDLRCTACASDGSLSLAVAEEDAREVRAGTLTCGECGFAYASMKASLS